MVLTNLQEALEIYIKVGDRAMVGRTFAELTDALRQAGRFQEAAETARRGLAYLQADVSAERTRLLAALASATTAGYETAHEALHEALNIASQLSDPKLEADVFGARSIAYLHFFQLTAAAEDCFLSERLGGSEAPPWQHAERLRVLHQTLLYLGRLEEALRIADELEPSARKIGQSFSVALCLGTRAWAEFGEVPDLAKLETALQQVSKPEQKPRFAYWEALYEVQLSLVDFLRGNWASAMLHAQACCRAEPGSNIEGFGVGTLFRQMAYLGDHAGALRILDEKRALLPLSGQLNTAGSWWMLASVVEGLVILEQSQAGQFYPLVRELIGTGAVLLWPLFRFTQTIAGVAAAAARPWEAAEEHFSNGNAAGRVVALPPRTGGDTPLPCDDADGSCRLG
jgi:tetratricopeptide (TPR) repeat protein